MARPPRPLQFEVPDFSNLGPHREYFEPSAHGDGSLAYDRFWKTVKLATFKFLSSRSGFTTINDESWVPSRFLGSGGFGNVGAWDKRSANGSVVDKIAVKEIQAEKLSALNLERLTELFWNPTSEILLREAVIHRQLNLDQLENIIHLRGFKFFKSAREDDPNRNWRFYLEYAPYGTLFGLVSRYRYFNQYLPEAFLWHVFDSLAACAQVMAQCSRQGLVARGLPLNVSDEVVDFDIKTENVFVGYREREEVNAPRRGGTGVYDYPIVKLGDFGLSYFTGDLDDRNPAHYFRAGTHYSRPPEQVHYGIHWGPRAPNAPYINLSHFQPAQDDSPMIEHERAQQIPGFDYDDANNFNFKLTGKVHVWAIGMVMFELMTLLDPINYWAATTKSFSQYQRNDDSPIWDFRGTLFRYSRTGRSPYSRLLTDLVQDCLTASVANRIDIVTLKTRTAAQMQHLDNRWTHGCETVDWNAPPRSVRHPKLFWRPSELNHMREGKERFPQDWEEFEMMKEEQNYDPDLPTVMAWVRRGTDLRNSPYPNATSHEAAWNQKMRDTGARVARDFIVRNGRIYPRRARVYPPRADSPPPDFPRRDQPSDNSHGDDSDNHGGNGPPRGGPWRPIARQVTRVISAPRTFATRNPSPRPPAVVPGPIQTLPNQTGHNQNVSDTNRAADDFLRNLANELGQVATPPSPQQTQTENGNRSPPASLPVQQPHIQTTPVIAQPDPAALAAQAAQALAALAANQTATQRTSQTTVQTVSPAVDSAYRPQSTDQFQLLSRRLRNRTVLYPQQLNRRRNAGATAPRATQTANSGSTATRLTTGRIKKGGKKDGKKRK